MNQEYWIGQLILCVFLKFISRMTISVLNICTITFQNLKDFFFFLAVMGIELLGLVLARQALYHLSHSVSSFLCCLFLR
jgi:hypothetical protein